MTANDLKALDAPTERRNYVVPSVTSRKDFPPSVTKSFHTPSPRGSKRSSGQAGLDLPGAEHSSSSPGEEELDTDDLKRHVEEKRRANTIAARKSRRRKAEFLEGLRGENEKLVEEKEQLERENEMLRQRLEMAERQLASAGVSALY